VKGRSPRVSIFVLVDALPWRVAQEQGFLEDTAPYRTPLKTVLGYSGAALPTLLSGKMPCEHGLWTMYRRAAGRSEFALYRPLFALARAAGRDGFVRRFTERLLPLTHGVKGYFKLYEVPLHLLPFFSLAQRGDFFCPGGLGTATTIIDEMRQRGISYRIWTWKTPERESFAQAREALGDGRIQVLFIYTPDLDAVMHAHGVSSGRAVEKLAEIETLIRGLLAEAGDSGTDVRLLVFSDHGMTDVVASDDLMGNVSSASGLACPSDYLAFYDSTMARFWGMKRGAIERLAECLGEFDCGRIVGRRELETLGLAFPDDGYGELVFLLEPGRVILPSFMGRQRPAAMHGYHPDCPDSDGVLMSNAPLEGEARHIADLRREMSAALPVPD